MKFIRARYRIAASAFYFIQGFSVTCWVSRLPEIQSNLALSDGALGSLLLAPPAGQLAAMALSGWLVRRFGSARMVRIAGLLLPALLPVLGLVSNRSALATALFLFGMATNLSNISINTQCVGVERLCGKSIMASFHGVWSLGGIGAILLGSFCAVHDISPALNFLMGTVLLALIYLLAFRSLLPHDERREPEDGEKRGALGRLLTDPQLWILGVICLGCLGCEGVMNNWSSIYFQKVIGAETKFVRIGFLVYMLSLTCCRFTAALFVRRWGGKTMIRLAGCLIMTGIVLMCFPFLIPASLGCALVGLGVSSIVPVCYGITGKIQSVPVASAITMVAGIGFMGFLLMPAAAGFIAEWTSLRIALFLTGLISFSATRLRRFVEHQER